MDVAYSVACRHCNRGWMGTPEDLCPECKKPVTVTGEMGVIPLVPRP